MIGQAWLNVVGLMLDFIGVTILAWEWWLAISAERRETEIEARERMLRPHPMLPKPAGPHQAVFDHMREDRRFRERVGRASAVRGMRGSWFLVAFLLIAAGFALQIMGSWPGCCRLVGIVPGGG